MKKQYKKGDVITFVYHSEIKKGTVIELLIYGYKVENRCGVFYVAKEDVR